MIFTKSCIFCHILLNISVRIKPIEIIYNKETVQENLGKK